MRLQQLGIGLTQFRNDQGPRFVGAKPGQDDEGGGVIRPDLGFPADQRQKIGAAPIGPFFHQLFDMVGGKVKLMFGEGAPGHAAVWGRFSWIAAIGVFLDGGP